MKCKKCGRELEEGSKFCDSCGNSTEETKVEKPNESIQPKENNFGWGILGFFLPIVGLILFIIWLKKNKKAAKAAGIGALIGGIIGIISIILFCVWFNGLFGIDRDKDTANIKIKKVTEKSENFSISDYEYEFNFHETYLFAEKNYYNAINESGKKIFTILRTDTEVPEGLDVDYTMVLNNGEEVPFDEYYSGIDPYEKYHFYYKDNLVIFNVKNDNSGYYFYDLDKNNLYTAFLESESGNKDLTVKDIIIDKDSITFKVELDFGTYGESTKKSIYNKVNSGEYNSLEDLEKYLKNIDYENFTLKKDIVFKKGTNKYIKEEQNVQTIKDLYNEKYGKKEETERTKDCIGKSKISGHEAILEENTDKECKTVTYKVNDDFTVRYDLFNENSYVSFDKYVNGKKIDGGLYPEFDAGWTYYISGKTLVTHEWATDLGAAVYLVNTKGEVYNVVNGANQLDYDGMTEHGYKVDSDGNLVISGIRHSNQCGTVLDKSTCIDQEEMCSGSYKDLVTKYNLPENYDFKADLIFKQNSKGLFDMNYSSKNVTQTLQDYYNSSCNR